MPPRPSPRACNHMCTSGCNRVLCRVRACVPWLRPYLNCILTTAGFQHPLEDPGHVYPDNGAVSVGPATRPAGHTIGPAARAAAAAAAAGIHMPPPPC